jgi:hypothetical protein
MNQLLVDLINKNKYKIGVEVGVRHGDTSKRLLELSCIEEMYGVDIRFDGDAAALRKDNRFKYLVKNSIEASKDFENGYFDFVYIDAGHTYEDVLNDLYSWVPKIRSGGLICGDDYVICHNPVEGHYGVVDAIEYFSEIFNINIEIIGFEGLTKEERVELALKIGKANEDNIWLAHSYLFPPGACDGRVRTENLPILNWYYFK